MDGDEPTAAGCDHVDAAAAVAKVAAVAAAELAAVNDDTSAIDDGAATDVVVTTACNDSAGDVAVTDVMVIAVGYSSPSPTPYLFKN